MPVIENQRIQRSKPPGTKQHGGAAVEFALLVVIFLSLVFGILELARMMYIFNILQEVTRRAGIMAANASFDAGTVNTIRSQALFSDTNGVLIFGAPITAAHIKIDYMSIARDGETGAVTPQPIATLPENPTQNYTNCMANPYGANCIRLVRVRICQPGGADDCTAVPYQMQFPFIDLSGLALPRSETIVPAQTLGYRFNVVTGL